PQPYVITNINEHAPSERSHPEDCPLVAIAVTTYNRERYIECCLDSVLGQSYQPVEVAVVDDGSTDGTVRILERYGNSIKLAVNDRNRGIAFSKNRALMMTSSSARYAGILDSDDYYHPQFVERCVDCLERKPDTGLVYTDDIVVDENSSELLRRESVNPW